MLVVLGITPRKLIESGVGDYGGKKSEAHKAAVTGDTVGDPCKDTAGPSLHVLVKLLSTITLVLYPIFASAATSVVVASVASEIPVPAMSSVAPIEAPEAVAQQSVM